ncbi:MAG TPA: YafY family protein [Nitrolancea sp.]
MNRTDRMLGILLRLRGEQVVTATDLARHFEVSVRTIYRDIEALTELGVPIYVERGRSGGFRLLSGYFLPALAFTTEEAISLALGVTMLRSLRTRPHAAALDAAERKLLAAMPEQLAAILTTAERFIGVEAPPDDAFAQERPYSSVPSETIGKRERQAIDTFLQGILDGIAVWLRYRSPYNPTAREITAAPRGAFWDRQHWYLVGEIIGAENSRRLWRADRVEQIRATGQPITPDPAFDVRNLLGRAWLRSAMRDWSREAPVRIRLTPAQADRLRSDWYYGQATFESIDDQTVVMTFGESRRHYVFALLRWLGQGAELLEPHEWRDELRDELSQLAAVYSATSAGAG